MSLEVIGPDSIGVLYDEPLPDVAAECSRQFSPAKKCVHLVLGTDEEIGQDEGTPEQRVALIPEQIVQLHDLCNKSGFDLKATCLRGCGARAGFPDSAYSDARCLIAPKSASRSLSPDVFVSLKEPSNYEAEIDSDFFLRIGALHPNDSTVESGFYKLAQKRNAAVFDGSNVGRPDAFDTPIKDSMSKFAGRIGAKWVMESETPPQKVVVVGYGTAGRETVDLLLDETDCTMTIFDTRRVEVPDTHRVRFVKYEGGINRPVLIDAIKDCDAIVLAVAQPRRATPKVLTSSAILSAMNRGIIVDISIDEGGAIEPANASGPFAGHATLIDQLKSELSPLEFRAEANMPRAYPAEASKAHGDAILPYLFTLLLGCACYGSPANAVSAIVNGNMARLFDSPKIATRVNHLKNGLACWPMRQEVTKLQFGGFIAPNIRKQLDS